MPLGIWCDRLTGERIEVLKGGRPVEVAVLLGTFPVALLVQEEI
jgi:hypothetical protein